MADTMIGSKIPEYLMARKRIIYNADIKCLNSILLNSIAGIPFSISENPARISFQGTDIDRSAGSDIAEETLRIAKTFFSIDSSSAKYHDLLTR
jgi:hypothetical protein